MTLTKSHKFLLISTFIGLVMMLSAFVSPGWFRVHYYTFEKTYGDDMVFPEKHHGTDKKEPVAMAKRDTRDRHHHHRHHDHHMEHEMLPGTKKIHLSFGLWYFTACVCGMNLDGQKFKKCQFTTYCKARHEAEHLPAEFTGANLESLYSEVGGAARYGLLSFQIEATVGLICIVIGMITAFKYLRNNAQIRCTGLTTVITHIIAGVIYAVIVGKLATMFIQSKMMIDRYSTYDLSQTHFHTPYCIILAGVGSFLTLASSFGLLLILSKGARPNLDAINTSGKCPGRAFGLIAPTGYQPFHGLADPPAYKSQLSLDEQAEPLPQKEAL